MAENVNLIWCFCSCRYLITECRVQELTAEFILKFIYCIEFIFKVRFDINRFHNLVFGRNNLDFR